MYQKDRDQVLLKGMRQFASDGDHLDWEGSPAECITEARALLEAADAGLLNVTDDGKKGRGRPPEPWRVLGSALRSLVDRGGIGGRMTNSAIVKAEEAAAAGAPCHIKGDSASSDVTNTSRIHPGPWAKCRRCNPLTDDE